MTLTGIANPEVHSYSTPDRQIESALQFDLDELDTPLTPEEKLVYDRAGEELQNAHYSELRSGEKRRKFVEYHVVNGNDEVESDCLVVMGFRLTVRGPLNAHAIQLLAAKHPEIRFLIPTTPGLDGTDGFPPEILKKLHTGSFEAIGEYLLEALRPAIDPDKPLDILAYSQGSSFGMGIAAASNEGEIRNVRAIDPAAIIKRKLLGMFMAVRAAEAHDEEVWGNADNTSRLLRGTALSLGSQGRVAALEWLRRTWVQYRTIPTAMCQGKFCADAALAIPKITGDISAIIGMHSEYNPISRVRDAMAHSAAVGMTLGMYGPAGYHNTIVAKAGSLAALA